MQPSTSQIIQTLQRCLDQGGAMASAAKFKLQQHMLKQDAMAVTAQYRPHSHSWTPTPTTKPRANTMLETSLPAPDDVPTKRKPLVNAIIAPPGAEARTRQLIAEYNAITDPLRMTQFMRAHEKEWSNVFYDLERCHSENPKFRTPIPGHTGRPSGPVRNAGKI